MTHPDQPRLSFPAAALPSVCGSSPSLGCPCGPAPRLQGRRDMGSGACARASGSFSPATQLGPLSVPDFSSKLKCGPSIGVVMSQHTDSEGLTHGASCVSNVALFKPCPQRWVQSPAVNAGLQGTLHACHLLEFVREAHELKILSCSRQGSLGLGTSTEHSAP